MSAELVVNHQRKGIKHWTWERAWVSTQTPSARYWNCYSLIDTLTTVAIRCITVYTVQPAEIADIRSLPSLASKASLSATPDSCSICRTIQRRVNQAQIPILEDDRQRSSIMYYPHYFYVTFETGAHMVIIYFSTFSGPFPSNPLLLDREKN